MNSEDEAEHPNCLCEMISLQKKIQRKGKE